MVKDGAGYGGFDDVAVDLRVDDHADPVTELVPAARPQRPLPHRVDRRGEGAPSTPRCAAELDERARPAATPDFRAWVGAENYEMRVADDFGWIDQQILEIIRDASRA